MSHETRVGTQQPGHAHVAFPASPLANGQAYAGAAPAHTSLLEAAAVVWGKWRSSLVLATRSLWLHKLRSMLSVLGIIIGTAAVISLMAFGEGSMQDALDDIKRQGATNIIVRSLKPPDDSNSNRRAWVINYGLTYADYRRFETMRPTVTGLVPMRIFPHEIRRLEKMVTGRVVATTEDYQRVNKFDMAAGRFLVDSEDQGGDEGDDQKIRNVVVLAASVAEALFPFEDPVGKTVVLSKHNYVVIGVMKVRMPVGSSASGQQDEDFNNDVYIPLRTCRARFGQKIFVRQAGARWGEEVDLHQITLTISEMSKVRDAGNAVRDLLEGNHQKKDWTVTVPLDRLEEAERAQARYTILLAFIAGISLLVGGIGIMNIMLATVTERTREIGIRRALGAKRRDITLQFIVEAVVQTSIGGLLGVLVGLVLVFGAPLLSELLAGRHLPARLNVLWIFLSLGVSIAVGMLFGWYPARRASRLDPIEALRHV
jgi:putative ABC transport system permease protein